MNKSVLFSERSNTLDQVGLLFPLFLSSEAVTQSYPAKDMAVGSQRGHEEDLPDSQAILWGGRPHVFIAGGLTFLGRNLIPALLKAGYGVRSMAITIEKRNKLRSLGCTSVGHGDPHSFEAIKSAAKGCQYAVHCATAFVHYDVSHNDIVFQSNSLVTSNIIRACKALRIMKLVLQSSEAVLYDGGALQNVAETYPIPKDATSSCSRSLQNVEQLVLDANCATLKTVVVRPRLLWGSDDEHFLPSILRNATSGQLRLVGQGKHLTSTCHVSNACEGIICALKAAVEGQVFFLTDGAPVLFVEFLHDLLTACRVENTEQVLSRSIPLWLARRLGQVAELLGKQLNSTPQITQSGIGLIGQEMTFNDNKARELIGFKSTTTIAQGLEDIRHRYLDVTKKHEI